MNRPRPDAPAEPLIRLEEVIVTDPRSGRRLLGPVSLAIAPGETVLLLGPSGSGKSTLLDVISGVIPHSVSLQLSGHVDVSGVVVEESSPAELARVVGQVPQDPTAATCLPVVEDEVALTLENHGVDPDRMDGRIAEVLESVGAGALRLQRTRSLSGGQGQRVATAAALAAGPVVVLADEPTSMLDAQGMADVLGLVAGPGRTSPGGPSADGAVILVEHRLDALAELPRRTVVLADGQVVVDGPTDTVLLDQGRRLEALGVWLPLEVELALAGGEALTTAPAAGNTDAGPGRRDGSGGRPRDGGPERVAPVLLARSLAVQRGGYLVLDDIDLDLPAGTVTALLGANGTGKTSLLLALAGLEGGAGGTLDGPGADGRSAMVFQNPEHQFMTHRVLDEVRFSLGPEHHDDAEQLLTLLRLDHLHEASPFRLSGGEKRRLSVAAALASATDGRRPLLLADEPTYGLDRHTAHLVMDALVGHARAGGAVVVVTHDLRQAAVWADRLAVLVAAQDMRHGSRLATAGPTWPVLRDLRSGALGRAGLEVPEVLGRLAGYSDASAAAALAGLQPQVSGR